MQVTKSGGSPSSVTFNTKGDAKSKLQMFKWWEAPKNSKKLADQVIATTTYMKDNQSQRTRSAAIYARLYGNISLYNFIGTNMSKLDSATGLPADRPTFNIVQSAIDTLVSRISQSRPAPVFLTDNGDYKERNLAKKFNNFTSGEFYRTKAYDLAGLQLRDALVHGTGILKLYKTGDNKVGLERRLLTELFTDPNESIYGDPRRLYEVKLVDRAILDERFNKPQIIANAEAGYPDNSSDSSKTTSDLVIVVEAWSLPSSPTAGDGRHVIVCDTGVLLDEEWTKPKFPFIFLHYSARQMGFWAQGVAEQLMGTQMEINSLLYTITQAIKLVGVPRVFQEEGSKVMSAAHNNSIGVIVKYRGIKPEYEVAPCNAPELYQQLERLIDFGYRQCGVSAMQASAQKPAGLNSGEAQRVYDDIATDRFASLGKKYDNVFIDLAYAIIDMAKEIAEETGHYSTVYPNKLGTREIDLTKADLLRDTYVIQAFNMSSLPRDPAGRMQKITEMIQAGMISIREGRRLLDFPDLQQQEILGNAAEERIFNFLDQIIEEGEYNPPDPFMDLALANEMVVAYYNLYQPMKLEEEKCQMLRTFYTQVGALTQAAMPPAPVPGMNPPQAQAQPLPQSPLVPNANMGAAA